MGMRYLSCALIFLLLVPTVFAAPSTTLTIDPSATAGNTITAADENDRNNDVVTAYNSHDHTDIVSTTANTFTVGNNATGNKSFAINNEYTTSPSIRYNNVDEDWEFSNDATNFVDFWVATATTQTVSNGTSANWSLVVDDDKTTAPAIRYHTGADVWQFSNNGADYINFSSDANTLIRNFQSATPTNTSVSGRTMRIEFGTGDLAGDTGASNVTETVTFSSAFATFRAVYITCLDQACAFGGSRSLVSAFSAGTTTFTAGASTAGGANFINTTTGNYYWLAIGE